MEGIWINKEYDGVKHFRDLDPKNSDAGDGWMRMRRCGVRALLQLARETLAARRETGHLALRFRIGTHFPRSNLWWLAFHPLNNKYERETAVFGSLFTALAVTNHCMLCFGNNPTCHLQKQ